jgi:ABC-type polysaccharide/polyol phosphate transport system ATPase subunit
MSWDDTLIGDTLVEVYDLGKRFALSYRTAQRRVAAQFLRTLLFLPLFKHDTDKGDEFWALRDINFQVKRGQALAVIGLNGAGKTTLLKILSGQLLADVGEVRLRGSVAAMIDLTAGFQDSMSGRQNIYVRGAMLGLSEQQLRAVEGDIIEFTELDDFIDAPIVTYSSGMRMRLAFAISVFVKPQVLIIDEILAVGDLRFHSKCLAKIREIRKDTAFILVTHSMDDAILFADEVIVLEKGKIVFQGEPKQAVAVYQERQAPTAAESAARKGLYQDSFIGERLHRKDAITDVEHFWVDEFGQVVDEIASRSTVVLRCRFKLLLPEPPRRFIIGVPMWTAGGELLTGFSTEVIPLPEFPGPEEWVEVGLKIPDLNLNPGVYYSMLTILDGAEFFYRDENPVLSVRQREPRFWGHVSLPHEWTTRSLARGLRPD